MTADSSGGLSRNVPVAGTVSLSPLRENIVDWLPMDKNAKVLEIGSGCGAITGKLAEKAGSVTCVELSKKKRGVLSRIPPSGLRERNDSFGEF